MLCDEIKTCISGLVGDSCARDKEAAFGRALGRVVSHELYHILARTTGHAARGLAKAAESLQDLVSGQGMPFRAEDNELIRKALIK